MPAPRPVAFATLFVSTMALDTASFAQAIDLASPYDGHRVVRADLRDAADVEAMMRISGDPWAEAVGIGPVDFRVAPERFDDLLESGIRFEVVIDDVGRLIRDEQNHAGPAGDWFSEYRSLDEILDRLEVLETLRPEMVEGVTVGLSLEGRPIEGIRISTDDGASGKPAFLINGCQHAREWISPMTVMFIADAFVAGYGIDDSITRTLDRMDFYIIPVSNPDGYEYTWSVDRLWRKNRRNNGDGSFGVDLNRNWSYQWGGIGTSHSGFSDVYCGSAPFSEPESAALRDFINDRPEIAAHVDMHSFSQLLLYPWGFTPEPCEDDEAFAIMAEDAADAIRSVHGVSYNPGPWYFDLYPSSGIMIDWAYFEHGIWSFTWELRDRGQFGFILPADQIIPTGEEVLAGLLEMSRHLPGGPLDLEVEPLFGGQIGRARVSRATPGARVYLAYSLMGEGRTPVPMLDVTLDLAMPRLAGSRLANDQGVAVIGGRVPGVSNRVIWLQAAELGRTSNVVLTQIN